MFFKEKKKIIRACRLLYEKDLIAGADGNVSLKVSRDGPILVTPSGIHKGLVSEEDLVTVDLDGNKIDGKRMPTSELPMHLAIYEADSSATSIVHAHPPWTLALSLAGYPFGPPSLMEAKMLLGEVKILPYRRPGSAELARLMAKSLSSGPAQILAHHGAVTRGPSLEKALELMECLEHTSKTMALSFLLGQVFGSAPEFLQEE
jgi:L-fuculose-phosphate aldolase